MSERGSRHLRELMRLKAQGLRPVQLYCVQRGDVNEVRPADGIDYEYGRTLREAIAAGVEVLAYRAKVTPGTEIRLDERIPVVCPRTVTPPRLQLRHALRRLRARQQHHHRGAVLLPRRHGVAQDLDQRLELVGVRGEQRRRCGRSR